MALVREEDEVWLSEHAVGVEGMRVRSRGYSLAEHVEIGRAAERAGLDLLHVPHYVLPLGVRCRTVVTVQDLIHLRLPRTAWHAVYAQGVLRHVRRRADRVIVSTTAVADDLVALARFDRAAIEVIPHGVGDEFLVAAPPSTDAVAAFVDRWDLRAPYVLDVTNGFPHKAVDVLAAAVAGIPGLGLALAGAGSDGPGVRAAVAAAGLAPERVVWLGTLSEEELRLAYRGAVAVAIPSLLEGFGLPALEAMALGTPVIASAAGGLPEVVGDAGILVPAGSVACLQGALYRITTGPHRVERDALIQRGLERARRFPWERTIQTTCGVWERVLAGVS